MCIRDSIKPLNVSAMLHSSPRSTVAPKIATNEYTTKNGRTTLSGRNRKATNRDPYSPQPKMVEKAKQHLSLIHIFTLLFHRAYNAPLPNM